MLIVRCGIRTSTTTSNNDNEKQHRETSSHIDGRALPVGFLLSSPPSASSPTSNSLDSKYDWVFARRYDPRTEEISNEPVEDLTLQNLLTAMKEGGELIRFIVSYHQFMGSGGRASNANVESSPISSWNARTTWIHSAYLQRRHGLCHGDKIVPCADAADDSPGKNATGVASVRSLRCDGTSMSYPPIPGVDPTVDSGRIARHGGTRAYLAEVSPEMRTWLLFGGNNRGNVFRPPPMENVGGKFNNAGEYVWNDVVFRKYEGNERDFLADIQLSFLVFLYLECHFSLEHWRDSISMCSLCLAYESEDAENFVSRHEAFFLELMGTLKVEMASIEADFFQEVDYSSGENNFLIDSLRRFCRTIIGSGGDGGDGALENEMTIHRDAIDDMSIRKKLMSKTMQLIKMVRDRFKCDLTANNNSQNDSHYGDTGVEIEELYEDPNELIESELEDEEDDGPVIVPYDQVEASIARSSVEAKQVEKSNLGRNSQQLQDREIHRQKYPFLYAAMAPQEDEVMACARILEEANDVSLVREAAAYLEEVEAFRKGE